MIGLKDACEFAEQNLDLECRLMFCFLRDLSQAQALDCLNKLLPYRNKYWIGVGLDSAERGNPPEKFEEIFKYCQSLGFLLCAHAGEEGSAQNIVKSLDLLLVNRIDHGVTCVEDEVLINRLRKERIPLTICPLSNVRLNVFPRLQDHVLPILMENKLVVCLNSDDPAYFGYLIQNFRRTFACFPKLTMQDAYLLAKNSIEASFAEGESKRKWYKELDHLFVTVS